MEKLKGKIVIKTVELHTGGDPVRIVVSGISRQLVHDHRSSDTCTQVVVPSITSTGYSSVTPTG